MAVQLSVTARNDRLDQLEDTIGASGHLKIWSGSPPANCAAADSGTLLSTIDLPADWMADAAAGVKSLLGDWSDAEADGDGTAGHFRVYENGYTECHMQGTVTGTGGGGDMEVNNTDFATGQPFSVTSFDLTEANP